MSAILDARCSKCSTAYRFDPDKPYPPTPTCHACLYATIADQTARILALEAGLQHIRHYGLLHKMVNGQYLAEMATAALKEPQL